MKFGYARTSTLEQEAGFEAQRRDLNAAGAEKIFAEQVSSVARRDQLDRLLDELRRGDVVIVTKLDRLARSMRDLLEIVDCIEKAGASLRILAMNLDTGTPTGKLMLNVLGSVAQFEREMMLERQREGIAKAKAQGKYRGRAPTAKAKTNEIKVLARSWPRTDGDRQAAGCGQVKRLSGARTLRLSAPFKSRNAALHSVPLQTVSEGRGRSEAEDQSRGNWGWSSPPAAEMQKGRRSGGEPTP